MDGFMVERAKGRVALFLHLRDAEGKTTFLMEKVGYPKVELTRYGEFSWRGRVIFEEGKAVSRLEMQFLEPIEFSPTPKEALDWLEKLYGGRL